MELNSAIIEGYRSLKAVRLVPARLTVLVGANGVGKTNLLHGMELIQAAAHGTICRRVAEEGGLDTALWNGRGEGSGVSAMRFAIEIGALRYTIEIGLPAAGEAALSREPTVREEALVRVGIGPDGTGEQTIMQRDGASVLMRDARGQRQRFRDHLMGSETALAAFRDSAAYPEVAYMRQLLESWRIYHRFPLGPEAASRRPSLALCTPALAAGGGDLAAALATIVELRQAQDVLNQAIAAAFPGARIAVAVEGGYARFSLVLPDVARPVPATQISEGALQLISLVAALNAFRPPAFIAINEPEAGIHESLIGLVAGLIVRASTASQMCIVTQSAALTAAIAALAPDALIVDVGREAAATVLNPRQRHSAVVAAPPQPAAGAAAVKGTVEPEVAVPWYDRPARVGAAASEPPPPAAPVPVAATMAGVEPPSPAVAPVPEAIVQPPPDAQEQVQPPIVAGELRQLEEARKALADIQVMVARLEGDPARLESMAADISERLAVLRAAEPLLPPEVATLTAHLEKELAAHAGALVRRKAANG